MTNNINWNVPAGRLGILKGVVPNATAKAAWDLLTVSGKTLYTNYIQSPDNVIIDGGEPEPPAKKYRYKPISQLTGRIGQLGY